MPIYKYKAKTSIGKIVEGQIEAVSESAVAAELRARKMELISTSGVSGFSALLDKFTGSGVGTKEIVIFSRQFATMINAGMPILQGLTIVSEQSENKAFRAVITKIRDDISNGVTLSEAMGKHPKVFNQLYVSMIRAGEQGGILDQILERLSEYLEKSEGIKGKVKSAMMYPSVVMLVAVLIVIFLMVKVIPTFQDVFTSFGAKLPAPTLIVIAMSHFLSSVKALILLAFIVAAGIAINIYRTTKVGALQWDALMLKVPVFGTLLRKSSVARFARTLGTLVKSGVPILEALETVAKTSGNRVVEKAVMASREAIREGKTLTEPLKKSGVFPPMVTQMINVGEETGALDGMLAKIADFYEEEVDTAVEGLTSIIEPILIVFLGGTLGFIVVAMFMPMFQLGNLV